MKFFHVFALLLLLFTTVFIVGCDEGMNMVKPVMMEESEVPVEQTETPETPTQETSEVTQPTETPERAEDSITTMGEMRQPEESEAEDLEEQEMPDPEVEPKPEIVGPETSEEQEEILPITDIDISAILPPEHVRRETPVPGIGLGDLAVFDMEAMIALVGEEWAKIAMLPSLHTHLGKPADQISLLPLRERQDVYNMFVLRVDLPHFIEASNKMVQRGNKLIKEQIRLDTEEGIDWDAYHDFYNESIEEDFGVRSSELSFNLDLIYFQENPEDMDNAYEEFNQANSRYWMFLEYARLQIQYPRADKWRLFEHFRTSAKNGWVLGLDDAWDYGEF